MALDDARNALQNIDVTKVDPPARKFNAAAAGIQAFGEAGGELRKGLIIGQQDQDIAEVVDAAAVIQTQAKGRATNAQVEQTGVGELVDLSSLPGAERVDEVEEAFTFLATAGEQGILSEAAINIEAEMILKKNINRAPGFAQEFRDAARDVLGIDPSGAALQGLVDTITREPLKREQTEFEKLRADAEIIAFGRGLDVNVVMRTIARSRGVPIQRLLIQEQIQNGEATTPDIIAGALEELDLAVMGSFEAMLEEFDTQGGVINTEGILAKLNLKAGEIILDRQRSMANPQVGVVYPQTLINEIPAAINQAVGTFEAAVKAVDMVGVMTRRRDMVSRMMERWGMETLPGLAMANAAGGEGYVNWWLTANAAALGDPNMMARFEKNPLFAGAQALVAHGDKLVEVMKIINEKVPIGANPITGVETPAPDPDLETLLDAVTADGLILKNHGSKEVFNDSMRVRLQTKPLQSISVLAQTPGGWAILEDDNKEGITVQVKVHRNRMMQEIAKEMIGQDQFIGFEAGQFKVINRDGSDITEDQTFPKKDVTLGLRIARQGPRFSSNLFTPGFAPGFQRVRELNNTIVALARAHPLFLSEQNMSAEDFVNDILSTVNASIITNETIQASTSPDVDQIANTEKLQILSEVKTIPELAKAFREAGLEDLSVLVNEMQPTRSQFFLDPESGAVIERAQPAPKAGPTDNTIDLDSIEF